jgi:hypothetical protein
MKLRNLIGLFLLIVLTTSCATLFTGTKSKVLFTTVPPGAKVLVNGVEKGVTPVTLHLKRSLFDVTSVTFKLDGYQPKTMEPETTFQPITILNLADPLGWAIDVATGAIVKFSPTNYEINLAPVQK